MGSGHSHEHGHGHTHHSPTSSSTALWQALLLTGGFLLVEVIGGVLTGSLALISDAAHMATDSAGLAIALAAVSLAKRPPDHLRSFGYQRFEILAAAFNALMLFAVAGYILYEGYKRIVAPQEIGTWGMLGIAVAGLVVNLIAMRILSEGKDSSLNVKGAYLEVWSDMLGSVGVIVAALTIAATGWSWIDPIVAIGIGLWVVPRTWALLTETVNVLLEGVPAGLDLRKISDRMAAVEGVRGLHDLHVWALTSNMPSLSAHIVLAAGADSEQVRKATQEMLVRDFHISHVTLQAEREDCRDQRPDHGLH